MITILKIEPSKEPYVKEIEDTLKSAQAEVGGYIEAIYLAENVFLICNEEGKLLNLPPNRVVGHDIIVGEFFLVGQKRDEFMSLTFKQIKKYSLFFSLKNQK